MPEDIVRLGIRVGSKTVVTANDNLEKLGKTAATTERKTERLGKGFKRTGERARDASGGFKKAGDSIKRTGDKAAFASKQMSAGFSAVARAAGVMAAAVLSVQSALGAIGQARQFNAALGEVSTLLEGTPEQMDLLERSAKRLAETFGTSAPSQVKAFYQAISAGADGVAGAAGILEAANKLAIGGITDVTTGVDVLTTAMNVYASEGIQATEVSDALFVAMKAGKTTIGELSASVGKVIPLAQKMGVSFDEVTATVAALTKGGISTTESVTGLRAILASVAKPTKEASDLAKKLGLEFDSTAVASKGLAGFIADIEKATKGNTDQMALLFGGVEALIPALALTGKAGEYLAEIMEEMDDKAGTTETAFEKMQKTLDRKLTTAMNKFRLVSLDVGQKLLQIVVPAVEAVANNLEGIGSALKAAAIGITVYFLPAIISMTAKVILSTRALIANRIALIATGWGAVAVAIGTTALALDIYFNSANDVGEVTSLLTKAITTEGKAADALKKALDEVNTGNAESVLSAKAAGEANLIAARATRQRTIDEISLARALNAPKIAVLKRKIANAEDKLRAEPGTSRGVNRYYNAALQGNIDRARRSIERFTSAEEALILTLDGNAATITKIKTALAGLAAAADETAKTGIAQEWDNINGVWKKVEKSGGSVTSELIKQKIAAGNLEDGVETLADKMQNKLVSAVSSIADAFGEFIVGGFRDFKGFARSILNTFKNMIAQMIATAVKNKILISLGFDSGGARGAARKGSTGEKILGFFNRFVGGGSGPTGGSAGGSAGSVGSAGGSAGSVGSVGSVGVAGAVLGAASKFFADYAELPAIASYLGTLTLAVIAFFKKKRTVTDTRLEIAFNDEGVTAKTATDIKTTRFFGLSKKRTTEYKNVDDAFIDLLGTFNRDSQRALNALGETFGINNTLDNFVAKIKFSIKGLSEDQINNRVTKELAAVREQMAELVVGSEKFVRSGETFEVALQRMATNITPVNRSFDLLGLRMFDISRSGANAASMLAELLGGISGFSSATEFYFNNFFDSAERLTINNRALSDTLAQLGVVDVPKSRTAFRGLLQEMQEIGNTGAVATLLKIAPLFIEIAGAADEAARASARLFRTRADEVFANSGPVTPFVRNGRPDPRITSTGQTVEEQLLRELLDEMRNGNAVIARNTDKSTRILDRMERNDEIA